MAKEYLDINGLTYLWSKLKTKFSSATNWLNGSATGSVRTSSSHAEDSSYTIGQYATAEGYDTTASGDASHAEGSNTSASGDYSHAKGLNTIAQRKSQMTIGEFNVADTYGTDETTRGNHAFIIGNGTSDNDRSNAFTVGWDGNAHAYLQSIDRDASTASSDVFPKAYSVHDKNGNLTGYVEGVKYTDGTSGVGFGAYRVVNGTDYFNTFSLGVKNDGTPKVNLTSAQAAAWRSALGVRGDSFNQYVGFDSKSISSGTSSYTKLGSISVPAGRGIVQGCINFGDTSSSTGTRRVLISTASSSPSASRNNTIITSAAESGATILQVMTFVNNSSATTYYLYGMQSSGSSLTTNGSMGYWISTP